MVWQETLNKNRVTAVIIKEDKVLLIHRFRDGREYWAFPGGSVEEGETNEQALVREVKEELNFTVNSIRFLFEVREAGRINYQYLVSDYSGELRLGGPEAKINSKDNKYILTWLTKTELKELKNVFPLQVKEGVISLWENGGI